MHVGVRKRCRGRLKSGVPPQSGVALLLEALFLRKRDYIDRVGVKTANPVRCSAPQSEEQPCWAFFVALPVEKSGAWYGSTDI